MREALSLARLGEDKVWPNPMVGALVVRDGRIVSKGFHARYGGPHAEIVALRRAGSRARGAELWVNLEPCVAFDGKRTPPCAPAVIRSGVRRVVLASADPNPEVSGRGIEALQKAGVRVRVGVLKRLHERLNAAFFKVRRTALPYVVCKWAMSLDGKIATRTGDSKWITSQAARSEGRELRRRLGAVLVGSGTVLADDPRLERVDRIVLDSMGRTPEGSRILRTARNYRTIFAVSGSCPESRVRELRRRGAEVHKFEVMDLAEILKRLRLLGVDRLLVEGGGEVHASALEGGLVDEVRIYVSPIVVGGRSAKSPVEGEGAETISRSLRLKDVETTVLPSGEIRIVGWTS
jgi:diaminohydroxyphosphoribosylaminopyrimidine deaminase/5-amino-6-(5-phosphoribosylamino)uracil reductase